MGDHSPLGLFMLHGETVQTNIAVSPRIIDVVPTILALLKSPIPSIIDGTIIQEAFTSPLTAEQVNWEQDIQKKPKMSHKEKETIAKLRSQLKPSH
jgi:hypothetical protein